MSTASLEQVVYGLVGVLPDQLLHALPAINQCCARNTNKKHVYEQTYLGHHGLAVLSLDVAKWHLGALMFVDLQLRVIEVGNVLQRDCSQVSFAQAWLSRCCRGRMERRKRSWH